MTLPPDVRALFARVKLLFLDVDGVLTDGGVWITENGDELRRFDARDGAGLIMLRERGIDVVFLAHEFSRSMVHRGRKLRVHHTQNGVENKLATAQAMASGLEIRMQDVAYCGDDLEDLPLLQSAGLALTVPEAPDAVKAHATYVTTRPGGRGAVREICDLLLDARGQ